MIANAENRISDYNEILKHIHQNEKMYPAWYKECVRDLKNTESVILKKNILEKRYLNEGLLPPFCYPYK